MKQSLSVPDCPAIVAIAALLLDEAIDVDRSSVPGANAIAPSAAAEDEAK